MKRKQPAISSPKSRKRLKGAQASPLSQHPHGEVDFEREYRVQAILQETKTHYLIDWEDDETTGEHYEPSWEPKANANKEAVADWKKQKTKGAAAQASAAPVSVASASAAPRRRGRPRKVVHSSPEASPTVLKRPLQRPDQASSPRQASVQEGTVQSNGVSIEEPEIVESQQPTGAPVDAVSPLFEPLVRPSPPPPSFEAGAYQKFSSSTAPNSSTVIEQTSSAAPATSGEQSRSVPVNFGDHPTRIIPDSQTLVEFSSSAPAVPEHAVAPGTPAAQTNTGAAETSQSSHQRANTEQQSEQVHSSPEQTQPPFVEQLEQLERAKTPISGADQLADAVSPSQRENESVQEALPSIERSPCWSLSPARLEEFRSEQPSADIQHPTQVTERSPPDRSFPFATQVPVTSSPIASVPDFSVSALGESAPKPPQSSSSRVMDSGTQDLAAKLKAIREKHRAARQASASLSQSSISHPPKILPSLAVQEQDRRSPSSVPAMAPIPTITREEMNTSERYQTLLPHFQDDDAAALPNGTLSRQHSKNTEARLSHNHVVPIVLLGHQRDQYSQTVKMQADMITRYLGASQPDDELLADAQHFVDCMRCIAMHPDLVNPETLTQYEDVAPQQHAQWAVDCSAKFRFLRALLDRLRDQTMHVAIASQTGRIQDILAVFLEGITVRHRRLRDIDSSSLASDHDGLMATLISANDETTGSQPSPADVIIALDPTVSEDCVAVKAVMQQDGHRPPFITLVVPGTVEHVEQSVSNSLTPPARLRTLVSGVVQLRKEAGKLEEGLMGIDEAAKNIAQYLMADEETTEWLVPTLETLTNLDSQTESELETAAHLEDNIISNTTAASNKRPLDIDDTAYDENEHGKRARIEHLDIMEASGLPATINPQDIEITHISDSVQHPTQSANAEALHFTVSSELTPAEQRLQQLLKETQDRLEEHIQALSDVQFSHEAQRAALIEMERQRDDAIRTAQQAVNRMTEAANTTSTLKAENTALKERLAEANLKLASHEIPAVAEFEALRLQYEQTKAEKLQLETRLESAKTDLEYVRSNYQNASHTAREHATRSTELENELAVAQNKATGKQAELRLIGYDTQTKSLRNENKKLKALLKDREAGLRFRDEEIAKLKEASRGRMGTRGTSVPRTPRLGSPMKMDGVHGRGSRQGSPAAGELKGRTAHLHPLRNG